MEMMGRVFIEGEFVKGMEKPFLHITLDKPTIEEIEPSSEVIMIGDSSEEDLKTTRRGPMISLHDGELKRD